jgi:hypothetical protein
MANTLQRQFSLFPECGDQPRSPLHRLQSVTRELGELAEIMHAEVCQLMFLEVTPNIFGGIELRGIAEQALDLNRAMDPIEVVAHPPAAMGGEPVPDDQQLALDLLLEGAQKCDDLRALEGAREKKGPVAIVPETL